jgi:hypothetical protein
LKKVCNGNNAPLLLRTKAEALVIDGPPKYQCVMNQLRCIYFSSMYHCITSVLNYSPECTIEKLYLKHKHNTDASICIPASIKENIPSKTIVPHVGKPVKYPNKTTT